MHTANLPTSDNYHGKRNILKPSETSLYVDRTRGGLKAKAVVPHCRIVEVVLLLIHVLLCGGPKGYINEISMSGIDASDQTVQVTNRCRSLSVSKGGQYSRLHSVRMTGKKAYETICGVIMKMAF